MVVRVWVCVNTCINYQNVSAITFEGRNNAAVFLHGKNGKVTKVDTDKIISIKSEEGE